MEESLSSTIRTQHHAVTYKQTSGGCRRKEEPPGSPERDAGRAAWPGSAGHCWEGFPTATDPCKATREHTAHRAGSALVSGRERGKGGIHTSPPPSPMRGAKSRRKGNQKMLPMALRRLAALLGTEPWSVPGAAQDACNVSGLKGTEVRARGRI